MSIKNLRFIRAVGGINMQRVEGTGSQLYREDENGRQCKTGTFVGAKYKNVPDRSEWTELEIKKKDLGIFSQAISWMCVDKDCFFPISKFKVAGNGIVIVDVPGRFSPRISHAEISEICDDYNLLSGHYLDYMDIFSTNTMTRWLIPTLDFLVKKSLGKDCSLQAWIARVISLLAQKK